MVHNIKCNYKWLKSMAKLIMSITFQNKLLKRGKKVHFMMVMSLHFASFTSHHPEVDYYLPKSVLHLDLTCSRDPYNRETGFSSRGLVAFRFVTFSTEFHQEFPWWVFHSSPDLFIGEVTCISGSESSPTWAVCSAVPLLITSMWQNHNGNLLLLSGVSTLRKQNCV